MIAFVGLSHLGMVYSLATVHKGFKVIGFDPDEALTRGLTSGVFPISEPGLKDLFGANQSQIRFTSEPSAICGCELVFVSLDVSTDPQNRSDLGPLRNLLSLIAIHLSPNATVVLLSQVPPGFTRKLNADGGLLSRDSSGNLFYQVETLVFGSAVERAVNPERIILGAPEAQALIPSPYQQWLDAFKCPVLKMRYESAELAKISINLFLVSTLCTTNVLAELCEKVGAEWSEISPALRLDRRIGPYAYLSPGLGYAGGNLERDLITVQNLASLHGTDAGVIASWQKNSQYRRDWVLREFHRWLSGETTPPKVAIWGIAYKANTHSTKNSPALALLEALAPFEKVAYDPQARIEAHTYPKFIMASSPMEACQGADLLLIMTPWPEFSALSPEEIRKQMKGRTILDPYGVLDRRACEKAGFEHFRLGSFNSPLQPC